MQEFSFQYQIMFRITSLTKTIKNGTDTFTVYLAPARSGPVRLGDLVYNSEGFG